MAKHVVSKDQLKNIARERLRILFDEAHTMFATDSALSHRYVQMARKVAMKVKLRMPREYKRQYCSHCYKYLVSGKNATIRVRYGKVIIRCLECKKITRIPIRPQRKRVVTAK